MTALLLGNKREEEQLVSVSDKWVDLYFFKDEDQRLGFMIKEAIEDEEGCTFRAVTEEEIKKEYGVDSVSKLNYKEYVFLKRREDKDYSSYLEHKEDFLEWERTGNDWAERKKKEYEEALQAEGRDYLYVLKTKMYQEGASSGYAWVVLHTVNIFKDEANRKGYMAECAMYGNDEMDHGNTFREMNFDELMKELNCEIFDDLRHEYDIKIEDRSEYDYSEYHPVGGILEGEDDEEE